MNNSPFNKPQNRKPHFAGHFYPNKKEAVIEKLNQFFSEIKTKKTSENLLHALIVPHAGWIYSGKVAAYGYNQVTPNADYKRVFVITSSHQFRFEGADIFASGNYETPLGEIKTDIVLAQKLIEKHKCFIHNFGNHENEHSLEVQLPFIQAKLSDNFLLLPIIIGTDKVAELQNIADALEPYFTPENLFVISTDFSHYPVYEDAVETDALTAEAICSNDSEKLLNVLEENRKKNIRNLATSLCGWTAVTCLLLITQNKKLEYRKIFYQNSGDSKLYSDKSRVVGYWAIAVYDKELNELITVSEQEEMLEKARNSIIQFVKTGKKTKPVPSYSDNIMKQKKGVFVSIYADNKLRGCVGKFASNEILNDILQEVAVSAVCDSRFNKLTIDELDIMKVEISVLSPLRRISSINEIELGKHGIYIKKGNKSGTFLPQVATKSEWNITEFLGHCSRDKAGLEWDGWKEAELFTFETFVFSG